MTNRRAFITGGGSGIGLATAQRLSADGIDVVIGGRSEQKLRDTGFEYVVMDVQNEEPVNSGFTKAGPINILVCNAGNAKTAPILKTSTDIWNSMISANLTGAFYCAQSAVPNMVANGWGRFIVVASTSSVKGYPYTGAYASAKHGVIGLTKTLAIELAKSGVTSNAVCPGFTDTNILQNSIDNIVSKTKRTPEEPLKALVRANPMQRAIQPEEVAHAISWLDDARSGSVNGLVLPIDGGELIS